MLVRLFHWPVEGWAMLTTAAFFPLLARWPSCPGQVRYSQSTLKTGSNWDSNPLIASLLFAGFHSVHPPFLSLLYVDMGGGKLLGHASSRSSGYIQGLSGWRGTGRNQQEKGGSGVHEEVAEAAVGVGLGPSLWLHCSCGCMSMCPERCVGYAVAA